jgi:hypothetical protein
MRKLNIRYEIDTTKEKKVKKDVHHGTSLNPLLLGELNINDPQIKEMYNHLIKSRQMSGDEAESYIEKFSDNVVKIN